MFQIESRTRHIITQRILLYDWCLINRIVPFLSSCSGSCKCWDWCWAGVYRPLRDDARGMLATYPGPLRGRGGTCTNATKCLLILRLGSEIRWCTLDATLKSVKCKDRLDFYDYPSIVLHQACCIIFWTGEFRRCDATFKRKDSTWLISILTSHCIKHTSPACIIFRTMEIRRCMADDASLKCENRSILTLLYMVTPHLLASDSEPCPRVLPRLYLKWGGEGLPAHGEVVFYA